MTLENIGGFGGCFVGTHQLGALLCKYSWFGLPASVQDKATLTTDVVCSYRPDVVWTLSAWIYVVLLVYQLSSCGTCRVSGRLSIGNRLFQTNQISRTNFCWHNTLINPSYTFTTFMHNNYLTSIWQTCNIFFYYPIMLFVIYSYMVYTKWIIYL